MSPWGLWILVLFTLSSLSSTLRQLSIPLPLQHQRPSFSASSHLTESPQSSPSIYPSHSTAHSDRPPVSSRHHPPQRWTSFRRPLDCMLHTHRLPLSDYIKMTLSSPPSTRSDNCFTGAETRRSKDHIGRNMNKSPSNTPSSTSSSSSGWPGTPSCRTTSSRPESCRSSSTRSSISAVHYLG